MTTQNLADKPTTGAAVGEDQPGLVHLNGVTWPWMVTQEALDALKDYDVWDDDVWITTHPKAGTHWILEIVNLVLVDGHEDRINRAQHSGVAEMDFNQPKFAALFGSSRPPPPAQYKTMKKWKAPRVIVTHLTEELMPTQIYQGKGKVVYVIRNPKDSILSYWHFLQPLNYDPRYEDWDYFVKASCTEERVYGCWFSHVLNFWKKHRYDKNLLFVKYEDLKKDTKGVVIQVADFLGKNLSDEAVDRVVKFSSLENMKARTKDRDIFRNKRDAPATNSTSDGEPNASPGTKTQRNRHLTVFRKGIVGDWKSKFTVAQNEIFDALYEEKMAGSRLKIEFE